MAAHLSMGCGNMLLKNSTRMIIWRQYLATQGARRCISTNLESDSKTEVQTQGNGDEQFRKLDLHGRKKEGPRRQRQITKPPIPPPRFKQMPVDQNWASVWPTAQTFKPSVVPLPLRQGYNDKDSPPGKFGNAELMKIPNFLHLTPPAIKQHCAAIKKFCTPWPKGLETDEKCEENFPLQVYTNDYCHSGPSLRDSRARIVTVKLKLSYLDLDKHAKDKLLRLVGDRYNPNTDVLTIVTDRCPLKKQNYDYTIYLLTALYHESWKIEPWESEKEEDDMEEYIWDGSKSQLAIMDLLQSMKTTANANGETINSEIFQKLPENFTTEDISKIDVIKTYSESVTSMHNEGEDIYNLNKYRDCVKAILHLPSDISFASNAT